MKALLLSLILQANCPNTITPELVTSLIVRESMGYTNKVSSVGAVGLMQVKPIVLIDYNREHKSDYVDDDLLNPEINLMVGVWHLCRYKFATKFKTELLQIYFTGFSRWKQIKRDADHPLWNIVNFYTKSIYYRLFIMRSLERIKELKK